MENNLEYKKYDKYESNPLEALTEVKIFIDELDGIEKPDLYSLSFSDEDKEYLFNYSIPGNVCSLLVRTHLDLLSPEDKEYCKNIIFEKVSLPLNEGFQLRVNDSVLSAIRTLPFMINSFPEIRSDIIQLLLLNMFQEHSLGMGISGNLSSQIFTGNFWENHYDSAFSLLIGYLLLKPEYDHIQKRLLHSSRYTSIRESIAPDVITQEYRVLS